MSSLQKRFAWLRSSLMGALHTIDEAVVPRTIIHLECATHTGCTEAIDSLRDSLGHRNVSVLVDSTPEDSRPMLCVRASDQDLRRATESLPRSIAVYYDPLSAARNDLSERHLRCLL